MMYAAPHSSHRNATFIKSKTWLRNSMTSSGGSFNSSFLNAPRCRSLFPSALVGSNPRLDDSTSCQNH